MHHSYFSLNAPTRSKLITKASFLLISFLLLMTSSYAQKRLVAEFYDGINFDTYVASKKVNKIDNSWYSDPPVPGVNPHRCSIRWRGKLKPGKSGNYKFAARVDDGIRVWIDQQLIIDQWNLNDVGIFQGSVDMVAGREYDLKVEYFNALLEGEVRLLWKVPSAEEKKWYQRIFGEDDSFTVIQSEFYLPPDKKIPTKKDSLLTTIVGRNIPSRKIPTSRPSRSQSTPTKNAPPKKSKPVKKVKSRTTTIEGSGDDQLPAPATIVTAKEAEKYIPQNIEFEQARTVILESSFKELNTFAKFMNKHPHLTVTIEGHTDAVGDKAENMKLSKRRAFTVARYLMDKGISRSRIEAEGYGGTRPLHVPEDGGYHPPNRRVVFVVNGTN